MTLPGSRLSRARRQELEYAFRLFDTRRKGSLTYTELKNLLGAVGISISRRELRYLQMEEDIRGMFILEDVIALCQSFYTDEIIEDRLRRSLEALFPGQKSVKREDLKAILSKLGRRVMIDESEIDACMNVYGGDVSNDGVTIDKFIEMVLSE